MAKNLNSRELEKLTDEELARRSLQDKEYFYFLIKRYEKKLLRYIHRLSDLSGPDSEDILQDIFIKTYCHLNGFNPKQKFSSWIYRVARNETISFYRRNKSLTQESVVKIGSADIENLAGILNDEDEPFRSLRSIEKTAELGELLKQLPRKYREVLVLRYLEEKKYDEISDILRKSPGTVATLINRAKSRFEKIVKNNLSKGEV
jgi:RNA polymerase sigma-70 factor (ECF subfamily)